MPCAFRLCSLAALQWLLCSRLAAAQQSQAPSKEEQRLINMRADDIEYCGTLIWSQNFESPTIEDRIAAQDSIAFPAVPKLTTRDGEEVDGVLPEASMFDASWNDSDDDRTVARVAYMRDLAKEQLSPNNYLNSEYGDVTSANDQQTCVAYNLVSNRNSLVREKSKSGGDQILQTDFPKGCVGPKQCGMAARIDLETIMQEMKGRSLEEATLSYRFKFSEGFVFGRGGKLPGLCGGTCDTGCGHVDGLTGWSARHMWTECMPKPWQQQATPSSADETCDTKLIAYPYHANKMLRCGDEFTLSSSMGPFQPQAGKWYTLTSYVKMNNAGPPGEEAKYEEDGILRTWIDDQLLLEEKNMLWRKFNNVSISQFTLSTFMGGGDGTWASPQDQYIRYDDIKVHEGHSFIGCIPPNAPATLQKRAQGDRLKRLIRKPFQELPNTSVGLRTKNLKKFVGYTRRRCWKECLSNYDCQSVLHLLGTEPKECYLLDSIAEHRLISIPEEMKGMLLYSNNRREMEMPPLGWNDTITGLGTGPEETCPLLFGAPVGEFGSPMGPNSGTIGRSEQCGGDAAWVAQNPPTPENTCRGFLHCHFFSPEVSACERTGQVYTAALDPCMRVGKGEQCGGDADWMAAADETGGVCCKAGLDCVYKNPKMARCEKLPEITGKDDPFGPPFGRPRLAKKNERCGGSVEGTALSDQCEEGLFCQHQSAFYAKCVDLDSTPIDFTSQPPHTCGDVGTQCMGSRSFLAGLGVDGAGKPRAGVCCREGLRCIFKAPFHGVCDDPKKYVCKDLENCPFLPPKNVNVEPKRDTRPRKIELNQKCGGSPFGTTENQCIKGLFCQYQTPTFAKCVEKEPRYTLHDKPTHECGGVGDKCMGDDDYVKALGSDRKGTCCKDNLRCVFQEPFLGVCAKPEEYQTDTDDGFTTPPVEELSKDTRKRTIREFQKCGGSPFGTTKNQCKEGLFCQYQTPTYAKCVKPDSFFERHDDPPHACGDVGTKCMGDDAYLLSLGDNRTGVCCKKGLRCVFQKPFTGLCADPLKYV